MTTQNSWNTPALSTNGQLLIGSTGVLPSATTLTSGAGILITNGAGSITITNTGATTGSGVLHRQVFTSSGTYTPTSGMMFCDVEVVGGGGGGGGAEDGSAASVGGGGGGGGYTRRIFAAALVGASQVVTVGPGGNGGAPAMDGNNGGDSLFGALLMATGGSGGKHEGSTTSTPSLGGAGGQGSLGDFNLKGDAGGSGVSFKAPTELFMSEVVGGRGGCGYMGCGAGIAPASGMVTYGRPGGNATSYGAGGGGAVSLINGGDQLGGNGFGGIVIITEYISVASGSSLTYQEVTTATCAIVSNFEYGTNRPAGVTFTLPAIAAVGTRFAITRFVGPWTVNMGAGQWMSFGTIDTTPGVGSCIASTDLGDSITAICVEANLHWVITASVGSIRMY